MKMVTLTLEEALSLRNMALGDTFDIEEIDSALEKIQRVDNADDNLRLSETIAAWEPRKGDIVRHVSGWEGEITNVSTGGGRNAFVGRWLSFDELTFRYNADEADAEAGRVSFKKAIGPSTPHAPRTNEAIPPTTRAFLDDLHDEHQDVTGYYDESNPSELICALDKAYLRGRDDERTLPKAEDPK